MPSVAQPYRGPCYEPCREPRREPYREHGREPYKGKLKPIHPLSDEVFKWLGSWNKLKASVFCSQIGFSHNNFLLSTFPYISNVYEKC